MENSRQKRFTLKNDLAYARKWTQRNEINLKKTILFGSKTIRK